MPALRVVIVEREAAVSQLLRERIGLRPEYAPAVEVKTGGEAVARLSGAEADIVFFDPSPLREGPVLMDYLLHHRPRIQMVLVSGARSFSFARTAIQCGAFDYLLKPLSAAGVDEVLARLELSGLRRCRQ